MFEAIMMDLYNGLHEEDKAYFRQSRESRLGKTLEECCPTEADREAKVKEFRKSLAPVRALLTTEGYKFLGGHEPNYAD